jgi:hypothetical protein
VSSDAVSTISAAFTTTADDTGVTVYVYLRDAVDSAGRRVGTRDRGTTDAGPVVKLASSCTLTGTFIADRDLTGVALLRALVDELAALANEPLTFLADYLDRFGFRPAAAG